MEAHPEYRDKMNQYHRERRFWIKTLKDLAHLTEA